MQEICQTVSCLAVAVVVSPRFVCFLFPHIDPHPLRSILGAIIRTPAGECPHASRLARKDNACDTLAPACDISTRIRGDCSTPSPAFSRAC